MLFSRLEIANLIYESVNFHFVFISASAISAFFDDKRDQRYLRDAITISFDIVADVTLKHSSQIKLSS